IRSLVLDPAQPPQVNGWEAAAANLNRAFGLLFSACAAQPACDTTFPGLAGRFTDAATRYDVGPAMVQTRDPITGQPGPRRVGGETVIALVADGLLDPAAIPYLPLAVAQFERGGELGLENLLVGLGGPPDTN